MKRGEIDYSQGDQEAPEPKPNRSEVLNEKVRDKNLKAKDLGMPNPYKGKLAPRDSEDVDSGAFDNPRGVRKT